LAVSNLNAIVSENRMSYYQPVARALIAALCVTLSPSLFAQGTSTNGAPPATTGGSKGGDSGKSAGINGGAGMSGNAGTDPATLSKQQTEREAKGKQAKAASN
jgi:hypothetical protein